MLHPRTYTPVGPLMAAGALLVLLVAGAGHCQLGDTDAGGEPSGHATPGLISNVFMQTDLIQALADVAMAAGVSILPDESVMGTVTLELKDATLQQALKLLLLPGGYVCTEVEPGIYLVTSPDPKSPSFRRIAQTQVVELDYADSDDLKALLPDTVAPFVKFDRKGNRVTVTAPRDQMEEVLTQIRGLDKPPVQVMIEALVMDVDKGALDGFKIAGQSTHLGLSTLGGLVTYLGEAQDIIGTLTWLKQHDKASIKANPRVVAQEGQETTFRVSTEQYFQMLTGRAGYEYSTLEAIESGVGLVLTPRVALADRVVTIKLKPEVGDVSGRGANNLPIITKRTADTTVRVHDGQAIVIGGLLQEIVRQTNTKIPLLGDLPVLGSLFRSHDTEAAQREVLIFIAPHILDDSGRYEGPLLFDAPVEQRVNGQKPTSAPSVSPRATRRTEPPVTSEGRRGSQDFSRWYRVGEAH